MFYRETLLGSTEEWIENYISSMEEDRELAREIIEVLVAHVSHLRELNVIPQNVAQRVLSTLTELMSNPEPLFKIRAEDLFEAIEIYLSKKLGDDADWIYIGRSRNDHIAAVLKLKLRKELIEILREVISLRLELIKKASEYVDVPMPLFTHLQPAQVSTFGHYLMHIVEVLEMYTEILKYIVKNVLSKSPLGSGAASSTIVPVDRNRLAELAGFRDIDRNSLVATGSRDFIALAASILTCLSIFLSRIAEDMVIFVTPQFNYIDVSPKHLSTSSIMPHKRNPVTMEVARAWGAESIGHLVAVLSILKGLPSGYNLDLQEINKHILRILRGTYDTLKIFKDFISSLRPNESKLREEVKKYPIVASDVAEYLSLKLNKPFRYVYKLMAQGFRNGMEIDKALNEVAHRLGVYMSELNPPTAPEEVLYLKNHPGAPNPKILKSELTLARVRACNDLKELNSL